MKRYIDADNMKSIKNIQSANFNSIESIREWIDEQPTADVVEVVRCKDCRWKQGSECVRFADVRPFPDDFCSRAERKEDGEIH